jgi:hypothetical protein
MWFLGVRVMSSAAESTAAQVLDLQALRLKLLGLRTEIDGILVQLAPPAGQEEASVAAATLEPAAAAPVAAAAFADSPAEDVGLSAPSNAAAPKLHADVFGTSAAAGEPESPEAVVTQTPAPVSNADEPDGEPAAVNETDTGTADLAPASSVDPDIGLVADDQTAPIEVAENDAPQADAEVKAPPSATTLAETPAPPLPAAELIPIDTRHRKEKADFAAAGPMAPAAPWMRRRMAARIAAGVVALVAAGAALMVADRGALGGTHVLPWVQQLPSYEMPWSFQLPSFLGLEKRARSTGDAGRADGAAGEALLARYREVWPVSP